MKKKAALRRVTLENDFGGQISFTGKLDKESLNFDENTGELVSEKIYSTEQGRTGYSVVNGDGIKRERRAYLLEDQDEICMVSNGSIMLGLDTDNLLTFFAKALAEEAALYSEDKLEYIQKHLNAVNE
ncbi:hypothetical protein [Maridesulfovibrio sp. FT414]|uniref:hypothetical protein n=1 Tax=Maridesulfovibrio sp. FT414 TaxID=2979469 RepID=UPI003D802E08